MHTHEYSITNGTLTIDTSTAWYSVYSDNGSTVNFSGENVALRNGSTDVPFTIVVYANGGVINFNNINTFINGFSYAGLQLVGNSSFTSRNFSLNNDRTLNDSNTDGGGYGVLIESSSFTAKGAADISLKANKNDGYTYAMYLYGTAPNAIFESLASISAEGNGVSDTVALAASGGASVTFEDEADITAQGGYNNTGIDIYEGALSSGGAVSIKVAGDENSEVNMGIFARSGSMEMADTVIDIKGGADYASAIDISESNAVFHGNLTASVTETANAQTISLLDGSILEAENVSVTAQGGSARGLYVQDDSRATLSGGLTIFVDGETETLGLSSYGAFSAFTGNITAEGENSVGIESQSGKITFENGVRINAAKGIYLQGDADGNDAVGNFGGYSEIIADKSSERNTGVQVRQSTLNMEGAEIIAEGGEATALVLQGGNANFSDSLVVNVVGSESTGINVKQYYIDGSGSGELRTKGVDVAVNGQSAVGFNVEYSTADVDGHLNINAKGVNGTRGLMARYNSTFTGDTAFISVKGENEAADTAIYAGSASSISFTGDVVTNALSTAMADGDASSVTFEKGLVTLAENTSITAEDGAAISVNSTGAGLVAYTGTTSVSDGVIDMTLNGGGSYWRMTGDSSASTLVNNGTLLDMTADGNKFSTLTLANLNGTNGLVAMDIDASKNTDNSDVILVNDTFSGTQRISFNRIDAQADADAAGTVIAKVNNNDGVFIAPADEEGALFYKRYLLDTKESETAGYTTDWYIKELANVDPSEKPTTTVNSVMSAASLNYHTWRTQNDKLMRRMGDLRKGGGANNGAWFRFGGSKINLGGRHGFDNEYMYYEVGYDRIIRETSKYTWFGGVAFSYGEGDSSYARGDGDNESKAVSLYLTQINKGGSYLDLVFKLGRWDDDFAVRDSYGERITGETENTGISFSAEYGKKIALNKNGFYIEPQAQLTYGHLDGDTYTTSNGVSVHQEGIESLVGRFGFNLGWDISKTSNIYLKASVLHEFLGDYGVSMSDATGRVRLSGDYGDTWFEYGLGAAFTLGKRGNDFLYFDVERSEGGDLDMEWRWNAGFRFEM